MEFGKFSPLRQDRIHRMSYAATNMAKFIVGANILGLIHFVAEELLFHQGIIIIGVCFSVPKKPSRAPEPALLVNKLQDFIFFRLRLLIS